MNEHHLNKVIVDILGLSSVRTPKDFLEKIGLNHKMIKLRSVLQESLPLELVPQGYLYVFTPNDGIRYSVDSKVRIVPTRMDGFNSRGTFEEASDYVIKEINGGNKRGKETSFNSIFFDEPTKEALRRKMEEEGVYHDSLVYVNPVKLPVRNYGLLTIHQFYVQPRRQ